MYCMVYSWMHENISRVVTKCQYLFDTWSSLNLPLVLFMYVPLIDKVYISRNGELRLLFGYILAVISCEQC